MVGEHNQKIEMKNWKIVLVFGVFVLGLASYLSFNFNSQSIENFAFAQSTSITIITLTKDNTLLSGGEYSIIPDPFTKTGTYTIKDNSATDVERDKDGIITIVGVKNGNYTITQIKTPSGYDADKLSKIIEVDDSSAVASFTNIPTGINSVKTGQIRNITYTAKFVCGSVFGDEGPLRPGHYDTDISILNKQNFPLTVLWNAVLNDGPSSNAIVKNLDSESSTGIICSQIKELLGFEDSNEKLVEGFAIIRIQLDSSFGSEGSIVIKNLSEDEINLLDVQVFYTANALPTLPQKLSWTRSHFT